MANLILPSRFTRQPQGAVEIAAEWAAIVGFAVIGSNRVDLASQLTPATTGTITTAANRHGLGTQAGSDSSRLSWTTRQPIAAMGDGYAMMVLADPVSEAKVRRALYLGAEAPSAYTGSVLMFNSTSLGAASAGVFSHNEYSSGDKAFSQSVAGMVDGNPHCFIVNRIAGTNPSFVYVDGVNQTASQTSNAGVNFTAGVNLHNSPANTQNSYSQRLNLSVVFKRPLSDSEIKSLSQNPWQIFRKRPNILYFDVATGGATDLTIADATATITGYAPVTAATDSRTASTGVATLTLAGAAPTATATAGQITQPGSVTLEIAGIAPSISETDIRSVAPLVGAAVVSGYAPSAVSGDSRSASPGAGAAVLTTLSPSVTATDSRTAAPGAVAVTIAGQAPAAVSGDSRNVSPESAAVTFSVSAPTASATDNHSVGVNAGTVIATGRDPAAVSGDSKAAAPEVGSITLSSSAPSVSATDHRTAETSAGAAVLTSNAPALNASDNQTVSVDGGAAVVSSAAPSVVVAGSGTAVAAPDIDGLLISGLQPTVATSAHVTIAPGAAGLAFTAIDPSLAQALRFSPDAIAAAFSGSAPSILTTLQISPDSKAMQVTGNAPSLGLTDHRTFDVPVGELLLGMYEPSLLGTPVVIEVGSGEVIISPTEPQSYPGVLGRLLGKPRAVLALGVSAIRVR